jgi:hypothetical protein
VTTALLLTGLEFDINEMIQAPTLECAHYMRLRILNYIVSKVQRCYHLYQTMLHDVNWERTPNEDAVVAVSTGLEGHIQGDRIRSRLAAIRDRCPSCKIARKRLNYISAEQEEESSAGEDDGSEHLEDENDE